MSIFVTLAVSAQSYQITFSGTGASNTVNTVIVENLTTRNTLNLNGDDILRLNVITGVNTTKYDQSSKLKIYPNPMTDFSTLEIVPPLAGDAVISVSEITGKRVIQMQSHLEKLRQSFRLSGLKNGFYLVNVKGNGYQFSGKLVSNGKSNGAISIEKVNSIIQSVDEKTKKTEANSKGTLATVDMAYAAGNRIKYTGISGNYSTVMTDIPVSNENINFNFIACTDGDNDNYPVVVIGTQTWIAENLKTTKYNDGTNIPNVTMDGTWDTLTTGAYCDYNNTPANSDIYGRLYNWYVSASTNPKNVCPTGWHAPSYNEWTTLAGYLGGESVAGGKLKETGTTHWISPNTGATNESGFTALPGGYRYTNGFYDVGGTGWWWTSDPNISDDTDNLIMYYNESYVGIPFNKKYSGFSVRCLKD